MHTQAHQQAKAQCHCHSAPLFIYSHPGTSRHTAAAAGWVVSVYCFSLLKSISRTEEKKKRRFSLKAANPADGNIRYRNHRQRFRSINE
jgi:hypothetical protein